MEHHRTRLVSALQLGAAAIVLLAVGCGTVTDAARELLDTRTPREKYEESLERAGLQGTGLYRDWMTAADRALQGATRVTSPHIEEGYLPPEEPAALAFRIAVRRGQRVAFDVKLHGDSAILFFVDAWQVPTDTAAELRRIAVADSGASALLITPRRDSEILIRAQPELLRGGRFTATVRVLPTLAFPVENARERDIQSRFGAPRDGGSRSHHGIDIFAPRGTPALAASDGVVNRVDTTPVGGNVVWIRDDAGNRLYYAHLDRQAVQRGQTVSVGDTIGFVGNTGNAITTPPHLHFGVYQRGEGPVDPYWFVHAVQRTVPKLVADTSLLGARAHAIGRGTTVRAAPDTGADSLLHLPARSELRVISATGNWYRVQLRDGVFGYIPSRLAARSPEINAERSDADSGG